MMTLVATTYEEICLLEARSEHVRPGMRRKAKSQISRRIRHEGSRQALKDKLERDKQADALADAFLEAHDAQRCEEKAQDRQFVQEEDYSAGYPVREEECGKSDYTLLEAVLPESVFSQLQAEQGSAFGHLSLFEAKSCTTQARFYRDDDAAFE